MWFRLLSILGILIALCSLGLATALTPGGFDWNRDFISTILRGPAGTARTAADVGVILYCASLALVFERLARAAEFSKISLMLRVGGIGSMVYSAFTITPLHDLVVTISIVFSLLAIVPLIRTLYVRREKGFFVAGCACLVVFMACACLYYAGIYGTVLPWGQRISYALFTVWLVSMDWTFPRMPRTGESPAALTSLADPHP